MSRVVKKDFIRTPHGGFNKSIVGSITPTENGVAVLDCNNEMIYWHEQADSEISQAISNALMNAVLDGTPIDWKSFTKPKQLEDKSDGNNSTENEEL